MWILGLWSKFKTWIIIAASVVFTILVAYVKGRGDGKDKAENMRLKDRLEAIIESEKIEDKVHSGSRTDIDDDYNKWMRDKER